MSFDFDATFSLIEWLAVTGLVQSVVILVYIALRIKKWRQGLVAISYFFCLATTFALQFALRIEPLYDEIRHVLWFCRAMLAPLCYLLVMQVILMRDLPEKKHFWVLACIPVFLTADLFFGYDLLYWLAAMNGMICMLAIWFRRDMFGGLRRMKGGRERYWLVIMLIFASVLGTGGTLLRSIGYLQTADADLLSVILGITFCYLATTTLFRVYPQPVQLDSVPRTTAMTLSPAEKLHADKIRQLMELDKLYHEPAFSRADLAREVGVSESVLSRIVNAAFNKSFPSLISFYRVEDAKRMLSDSDIAIQVIAFEVGFNSLASFNRVFREVAGESPSAFRGRYRSS